MIKYLVNENRPIPLIKFDQPKESDFPKILFKNQSYEKIKDYLNPYCSKIIKKMLSLCKKKYKHKLIDIKVHNLFPRKNTSNNLWHLDSSLNPVDEYENFLFVSGYYALTEFVVNPIVIPHQNTLKDFSNFIESDPSLEVKKINSCLITKYDGTNVHRGPKATGIEKRLLIRLSNTDKSLHRQTFNLEL